MPVFTMPGEDKRVYDNVAETGFAVFRQKSFYR
jgi:hypothetical protein